MLQVIDTLNSGGAERFAVNLANSLSAAGYQSSLCTTRTEGPLAEFVAPGVGRLNLGRRRTFDVGALRSFREYFIRNRIDLVHAHSSSLYLSVVGLRGLKTKIIWHLHQGRLAEKTGAPFLMKIVAHRADFVVTVSRSLADWAIRTLGLPETKVRYIPNYVEAKLGANAPLTLAGKDGYRLVCVANLRKEKDTLGLLAAMSLVVKDVPAAQLFLVGGCADQRYCSQVRDEVVRRGLSDSVTLTGPRKDVSQILRACDIGVISSAAEGLPLALLEYGEAGLATVSTNVGACGEVLDYGNAGLVVPPLNPAGLASAIISLLRSAALRHDLGQRLKARIQKEYSEQCVLEKISAVYRQTLATP